MLSREKTKTDDPRQEVNDYPVKEKYVLSRLLPEYVSLYRIDLNSGKYEILRLDENTNARKLAETDPHPAEIFDEYTRRYADNFILDEEKEEFIDWHLCANMKRRLLHEEKLTYHYHSVSKEGKDSYYEAYVVKGKTDDETFDAFLGYRNIDSILYKEKEIQEKLQKALNEARLGNEIISSIARTYQYISRIDIQADYFEEISNRDVEHLKYIHSGTLSENNKRVCRGLVAEEYQDAFEKFTDISTLPERMKDEESVVMEYRMKDGSWHSLRFIEKKRDETGRLTHVLCAIRSISDAKRREQTLIYQVAEAKKDAAVKTRFLSNMSHDIRTPMNGIIGMVELANRYPNDPEIQQKCRDKIMDSSRYLVSLVNDILDMNKLESGDIVDQELTFDLTEILSRINTEKQLQAAEKNIECIVDWEKSELSHILLTGNSVYLERLLNAISDNAVKFTEPGGRIHVWCKEKFADEKRVVYEFGCADNGPGMSQEFVAHAFDLFAQEKETSRSKYEGTGLGLSIAKKLTDRMGGTIRIESKEGTGTTVIMTIPFKIGEAEKARKLEDFVKDPNTISLEGLRALVVEDNELNMEIASFMLEDNGIIVDCAKDGLEAIGKFEKSEPGYYDVILMDIMMPNLNGWDTARRIRSMKRSDAERVPVIAMSANAFAEDIINSRISGMDEHLTKPLEPARLVNVLKDCIWRRKHKL